tara:strand:+ start:100 stop:399 length:300 start_codon:yes stop_codon:yes gene_type:complete
MNDNRLGVGRVDALLVREVNLHELLEVEKGKIVVLVHPEEFAKRSIRLDVALVCRVLKVLGLAVLMNLLGDISSGDETIFLETEELTHLCGDRTFFSEP